MTEYVILPLNHWYYQAAQLLFCMSYIPVNLLYLRLCLLGATFFITIWCIFVLAVSLDGAIWNGFQTCVNVALLIGMYTDRLPVSYSQSGDKLCSVLGKSVPRRGLKPLIESAQSVVLSSGNAVLVREGEQFTKVFILLNVEAGASVYATKNGKRLGAIRVGQMVGAWEFMSRENQIKRGGFPGSSHSITIQLDSGSAEFAAWELSDLDTILRKNGSIAAMWNGMVQSYMFDVLQAANESKTGLRVSEAQYEYAPDFSIESSVSDAMMSQLEIDDVGMGEKSDK